jgi:hypothetical protein
MPLEVALVCKATCLLFVDLRDRPPENDGRVVGKIFFLKSHFLFFSDIPEFQVGDLVNQQIKNMWPKVIFEVAVPLPSM